MMPLYLGLALRRAHNKHLKPVFDIGKARVWVEVECKDVRIGACFAYALHNSAANDMIGQTAERLQNNERTQTSCIVVQNLSRNQHAFPCIKTVMHNWVTCFYQFGHSAWWLIKRVRARNAVA